MLTDLKVSSLACFFVFYKTKPNVKRGLKFEGLEMQKQNIEVNRT